MSTYGVETYGRKPKQPSAGKPKSDALIKWERWNATCKENTGGKGPESRWKDAMKDGLLMHGEPKLKAATDALCKRIMAYEPAWYAEWKDADGNLPEDLAWEHVWKGFASCKKRPGEDVCSLDKVRPLGCSGVA